MLRLLWESLVAWAWDHCPLAALMEDDDYGPMPTAPPAEPTHDGPHWCCRHCMEREVTRGR